MSCSTSGNANATSAVFVSNLEQVVIDTLAAFNIKGERRDGRIGVWVARPERGVGSEDKIAAIGVRVSKWVSYHGLAINVSPDLTTLCRNPCHVAFPITASPVSRIWGNWVSMPEVDVALKAAFAGRFGTIATRT